jgi:RNA 3'-phosphate cyclase
MIEIDGAFGEGGGQLVRTAVALAAVTSTPIRVTNIRARRSRPGLAEQHVAAVRAVAAMCDARCDGVEPRSTELCFSPRRLRGGTFQVDVGTAGSVTLVLKAMLPAAAACGGASAVSPMPRVAPASRRTARSARGRGSAPR